MAKKDEPEILEDEVLSDALSEDWNEPEEAPEPAPAPEPKTGGPVFTRGPGGRLVDES